MFKINKNYQIFFEKNYFIIYLKKKKFFIQKIFFLNLFINKSFFYFKYFWILYILKFLCYYGLINLKNLKINYLINKIK